MGLLFGPAAAESPSKSYNGHLELFLPTIRETSVKGARFCVKMAVRFGCSPSQAGVISAVDHAKAWTLQYSKRFEAYTIKSDEPGMD